MSEKKGEWEMLEFYIAHKVLFWCSSIISAFAVCTVHYYCFIRRGVKADKPPRQGILITRFKIREQISHWLRIIMFLILLFTGIEMLLQPRADLGPHHGFLGVAFVIVLIINLFAWLGDMTPGLYDLGWLRSMGGYLSREEKHLVAGRFNAGQKVYFWIMFIAGIILLVSAIVMEQEAHHALAARQGLAWGIHGITGCLVTFMVIGHAYLSIVVNPESARVLLDGKIDRDYILKHHGMWLEANPGEERSQQNDLCPAQK